MLSAGEEGRSLQCPGPGQSWETVGDSGETVDSTEPSTATCLGAFCFLTGDYIRKLMTKTLSKLMRYKNQDPVRVSSRNGGKLVTLNKW